jgi:hypothetical protein
MRKILNKPIRDEKGQALLIVLILLLVGGLIIAPLLGYMSTGLKAGKIHEERMQELYAADAGVEDALYKIKSNYTPFVNLDVSDNLTYTLTNPVNGKTVNVTVSKMSLLESIVDDSLYNEGQPHEDWITFDTPAVGVQTADYVEYSCNLTFNYVAQGQGVSPRTIDQIGVFFSPVPGVQVDGPYDIIYTPKISATNLQSVNSDNVAGGFAFIWTWKLFDGKKWSPHEGPLFNNGDTGALSFKFKVYDPEWVYSIYFVWALVKQDDISFVTNAPGCYQWLIVATAADTEVSSAVLQLDVSLDILDWQVSLK